MQRDVPLKVYEYADRRTLGDFLDIKTDVHKVLSDIVLSSSEKHVVITKSPTQSVHVQKRFKAEEMHLIPATGKIQIVLKSATQDHLHVTDTIFQHGGNQYVALLHPQLQYQCLDTRVFAYWAVRTTYDQVNANCKYGTKETLVKTGRTSIRIVLPILQNTKELAAGDELILYVHKPMDMCSTSAAKKRKADETSSSSASTPSADSKGKKAKGKGNAKAGKGKGKDGK